MAFFEKAKELLGRGVEKVKSETEREFAMHRILSSQPTETLKELSDMLESGKKEICKIHVTTEGNEGKIIDGIMMDICPKK